AVADLNGDGKLDVAATSESLNLVAVFLGQGNGSFVLTSHNPVGNEPAAVTIGDLNGDGKTDLVTAKQVHFTGFGPRPGLLRNGDGTFGARTNFSTGGAPQSVAIGDLNGDGRPDLAAVNDSNSPSPFANSVSVLLGNGDGSFGPAASHGTGVGPRSVAIGD